jgi:hypothetical protein
VIAAPEMSLGQPLDPAPGLLCPVAQHRCEEYLDAYLAAARIAKQKGSPPFRTLDRHRQLTGDRIGRREVLAMIKRRARQAGLRDAIGCHTRRATGIAAYLANGGTIDMNQPDCLHRQSYSGLRFSRESPVAHSGLPPILARPMLRREANEHFQQPEVVGRSGCGSAIFTKPSPSRHVSPARFHGPFYASVDVTDARIDRRPRQGQPRLHERRRHPSAP